MNEQLILEAIGDLKSELKGDIARLETRFNGLETSLASKFEVLGDKFDNYKNSSTTLVNLAFSLIGSATVAFIVATVLR